MDLTQNPHMKLEYFKVCVRTTMSALGQKTSSVDKQELILLETTITNLFNYKINDTCLKKVADSIYTSKIRYGIQLCGKIRWSEQDPKERIMKDLQKTQNKLLRFLNNSKLDDKIPTVQILDKLNMLSTNQINAQSKLLAMWKMSHSDNYPPEIKKMEAAEGERRSRAVSNGNLIEEGKSTKSQTTFINDSSRAWNRALVSIISFTSIYRAKKSIKCFVKTLPI